MIICTLSVSLCIKNYSLHILTHTYHYHHVKYIIYNHSSHDFYISMNSPNDFHIFPKIPTRLCVFPTRLCSPFRRPWWKRPARRKASPRACCNTPSVAVHGCCGPTATASTAAPRRPTRNGRHHDLTWRPKPIDDGLDLGNHRL